MIPKECKRLAEVAFSDCRGLEAFGAGEGHPAWVSEHSSPMAGAEAAGGVQVNAPGATAP